MEVKSYDRTDKESSKAYEAFCVYLRLGVARSLNKAAGKFCDDSSPPNYQIAKRRVMEKWSKIHGWVARCKDYDRDEEILERDRQRTRDRTEHDRKLEEYRSQNENLGSRFMVFGDRMLKVMNRVLDPIERNFDQYAKIEHPTAEDLLKRKADWEIFRDLATSGRSAVVMVATGSTINADGLLIRQTIEQLREAQK